MRQLEDNFASPEYQNATKSEIFVKKMATEKPLMALKQ